MDQGSNSLPKSTSPKEMFSNENYLGKQNTEFKRAIINLSKNSQLQFLIPNLQMYNLK